MSQAKTYVTPNIQGTSYALADIKAGGIEAHLEALITANATATSAPDTAPTANATGGGSTGGLLAAGTYYLKFTETNGIGETTASPESLQLTVSATNIPRVTFPTLKTGNTARNLYVTAAGGATGTEVLYASGITTGTYDMAVAAPTSTTAPPTANTTALSANQQTLIRHIAHGRAHDPLLPFRSVYKTWLAGAPLDTAGMNQVMTDAAVAFGFLKKLMDEIGTLVLANPGTINRTTNAWSGLLTSKRVWP